MIRESLAIGMVLVLHLRARGLSASRPLQLDGGSSLGSDNRGQSVGGQSEGTERSDAVSSDKSPTRNGKTGETAFRGRSQTHIGLSVQPRHRVAIPKTGHGLFVFNHRL